MKIQWFIISDTSETYLFDSEGELPRQGDIVNIKMFLGPDGVRDKDRDQFMGRYEVIRAEHLISTFWSKAKDYPNNDVPNNFQDHSCVSLCNLRDKEGQWGWDVVVRTGQVCLRKSDR